jgi:aminoglycoside phosphotransferase
MNASPTGSDLLHDLRSALDSHGFSKGRPELIRHGSSSVYELIGEDVIVRVSREPLHNLTAVREHLRKLIALSELGAPILAPCTDDVLEMPVTWATLWPRASEIQDADRIERLGRALRLLHELRIPSEVHLPAWSPAHHVRLRLSQMASISGLPRSVASQLQNNADTVLASLPALEPSALVHGDAYGANLMEREGRALLIDLDDLSVGPPEVDFAPTLVSSRRFEGNSRHYEQLLTGYGAPIVDGDLLNYLATVRELTMNLWLATLWDVAPRSRTQLEWRMATWSDPTQHWSAF